MRKLRGIKLTESVLPVIALLSAIFLMLLYVEYRATQEAEATHLIHITAQSSVETRAEEDANSIVEVDFSSDPRIEKAQAYIAEKAYDKAEAIYFSILAKEPSAQIHNWLGTLYLKEGLNTQAVVSFSNALKLNSNYYRARYNRALAYSALDEPQKAISDYNVVILGFVNHAKSHFNLGLLYYQLKDYPAAITAFRRTAQLSSGDKEIKALYLLGKSYMKINPMQKQAAIDTFNKVIRLKPNHIGSRLALVDLEYPQSTEGLKQRLEKYALMLELEPENIAIYRAVYETYHRLGMQKSAKEIVEQALLHEPNNITLQFELVHTLVGLKEYDEAIVYVKNILTLDEQNSKAYFRLGRLYYLKGDFKNALVAYEKVMTLKERVSPELWNNMGLLYSKMKRFDDAFDAYMQALALRRDYAEVYYNLGVMSLKQKAFEQATNYFREAIARRENYAQAYYNLALSYANLQQNKASIEAYKKVLALKPNDVRIQLNLAVRYSKVGSLQSAQTLYLSILGKDDSYYTAWLNLGLVYLQQKKYVEAIEALEKAITLEPESSKARRALAKSHSLKGDDKAAIEILYRLLAQNPADIKTRLAYARSYYRAKKRNTALREYQKVLKLDPTNKVAIKMIDKIETRKRKKNEK